MSGSSRSEGPYRDPDEAAAGLDTPAAPATRPARAKRVRGLRESLLSIVLGMEAAVMFFATLVVFGLHILSPLPALLGGGIALVVLVVLAGLQRWAWAVYAGAVAQLGLILLGILTPAMYVVGAIFAALWTYCFIRSRQIERRRPPAESESP